MATPTAPNTNLAELPPEIFEAIAEHTGDTDLKNLRLTSRECGAKVLRTYATRYFSEMKLSLQRPESIVAVEKIAAHPELGRRMHRITLLEDEPYSGEEEIFGSRLLQLFCRLRLSTNVSSVRLCPFRIGNFSKNCEGIYVFSEMMQAIHLSGLQVTELVYVMPMRAIRGTTWFTNEELLRNFGHVLSPLKTLSMSLNLSYAHREKQSRVFASILGSAVKLETLTLRIISYRKIIERAFAGQILKQNFARLRSFTLEGVDTSPKELVQFFRQNGQLESLNLKNKTFDGRSISGKRARRSIGNLSTDAGIKITAEKAEEPPTW